MLALSCAAAGLTINTPSLAHGGLLSSRTTPLVMKLDRLPGEGDPFPDGKVRMPEDVFPLGEPGNVPCPRGISDATVIKKQYIETDDEPWHSTCRPVSTLTKQDFATGFAKALPFFKPEYDLEDELVNCQDDEAIDKAVEACIAAGGRPGCPAIEAANKLKAEIAKAVKAEKALPKYKPKRPAVGGATPGWKDQGENRVIGKTHDNSV